MDLPDRFHFTHRRTVEFADTDAAGIMHFTNFLRFAESAEHAFFRSLGFPVHTSAGALHLGWPRVEVACQYLKPARFEETLEIGLRLEELHNNRLTYRFWIFGPADTGRPLLATGSCRTVHVALDPADRRIRKTSLPADLRRALEHIMASPPPSSPA